jgi:hypothetical protein
MATKPDDLDWMPRWLAGACGGILASLAQGFGQESHLKFLAFMFAGESMKAWELFVGGIVTTVIMMAIASLVAFFSDEKSRRKLFWMGIGAPALIAMMLPGAKSLVHRSDLNLVSPAYAQTSPKPQEGFSVIEGVKMYLGLEEQKYRVVVGSYLSRAEATTMLERVRRAMPDQNVYTADPRANNKFYGVIVGPELPLAEAQRFREEVSQKLNIRDVYLSKYPPI